MTGLSSNPYMTMALEAARNALATGDVPVGAVVIHDGQVVGRGWNRREAEQRVTAHAELVALDEACLNMGSWKLEGCDLYVTLEPCPMCASAIVQARIRSLYYGAWDPKAGAAGSVTNLFDEKWLNHRVTVYEGICEIPCRTLLTDFFQSLRD